MKYVPNRSKINTQWKKSIKVAAENFYLDSPSFSILLLLMTREILSVNRNSFHFIVKIDFCFGCLSEVCLFGASNIFHGAISSAGR